MARGLWKGAISFGLVHVPVELHSAQKRSSEIDLTMLDRRVNKSSGAEVPWEEIVKGYEYQDGSYVVLSEEDFRRANPEASRTVEIAAFVELGAIPPQFFDTPYYLAPGKRGEKAYVLLRETLKRAGKAGIATVVIRTRQYLAALLAQDEVLLLNTLRYADELKSVVELGFPLQSLKSVKVSSRELDMALRLVEDMSEDWEPGKYRDTYRDDLLKRIEQKVKAGQTEEITEPGEQAQAAAGGADVIDLMALLKKSVARKADRRQEKPRRPRKRRAA
jgi:DNA end-binding protein Ku